ncbi:MAG: sugar ABC transporter ATP-binding protein [Bacilli bacterium]|nr:sugar ABC transporter ATP-binding protein [Bacilli bacterium]
MVKKKSASKSNYILEIINLSKAFGKNQVLCGVNIRIPRGSVMGLMGENGAGKSTLMKCLFGMYAKDTGTFRLDGKEVDFKSSKEALENGVAMVHQELNQCLDRTIQDNLFLGRYLTNFGVVNEKAMYKRSLELFSRLDMKFNPKTMIKNLSVSQRQMVEIARAISYNAKVIVLDEPTSSLSERETRKLFEIINNLKKTGVSFVFISHKMNEIFELCDNITVLRDGVVTLDKPIPKTNLDEVVKAMIGRSLTSRFPPLTNKPGDVILKVNALETKYKPYLKDIDFNLRKGEILGVYGLVGAGRTELLECLFGCRTIGTGAIRYKDKRVLFTNPKEAMNHNFAFVTEERKVSGMFANCNLTFNTCITNLDKYKARMVLINNKMNKAADLQIGQMHVKCSSRNDMILNLSGGNQQKVIIGKWLERAPDVFLMDEPTRGIDIMAKYQIYELMIELAKRGKSIIMVSSEMPEILGVTNRVIVMSNYRIAGELETKKATQEQIMRLCTRYL